MKKSLKMGVSLLMTLLLLLSFAFPIYGDSKSLQYPGQRWLALYSGAYMVSHVYDGSPPPMEVKSLDWWKDQETKLQALSEEEFLLRVRENLLSVIARFDRGENIRWNKEFVQTMVKANFPDLYEKIESQINQQEKEGYVQQGHILEQQWQILNYTPGSRTRTFDAIMCGVFGNAIWGFFCQIYWVWNSTSITSIQPSTWGEAYAPLWTYDGIIGNQQNWVYPYWEWHKWVKGQFTLWSIPYLVPVTHNYPWLDINILAGGDSYYSFGL